MSFRAHPDRRGNDVQVAVLLRSRRPRRISVSDAPPRYAGYGDGRDAARGPESPGTTTIEVPIASPHGYCMNSASLRFIEVKDLKESGYGEFLADFPQTSR